MRVVIMGGTSGIGLATAEALADRPETEVIVTGRDEERLAAAAKRVPGLVAERVDGTDAGQVTEFFERIGSFEHLVLAFSPGAAGVGPLREVKRSDIRLAFEGKLYSYLQAIALAQVTGSITLLSAMSSRAAIPGTAVLASVNGAVDRIVPPLAAELAPVRVNAVSPGPIDTPWWSWLPEDARAAQFEQFAGQLPAKRIGRAEEVADAIRYLIGASYVTGAILPVDGGGTVA
jgi:NAD(P)-dependent dehydrogenase (short-subunit alcohol dehydrogenase family)